MDLPGSHGKLKVWSLGQDDAGRMWVGTTRGGAYLVEPGAKRARAITEDRSRESLSHAWITTIAAARPREIWLGTNDRGIIAVDTVTLATRRIHHDPPLPATLPADGVRVLFRERSGLVWVGTNRSLGFIDPQDVALRTLFGVAGRGYGITDPAVNAVLVKRNGRVWLGLATNGVDILDPFSGRVGAIRPDPRSPQSALPNNVVNALVESTSDVYLGTDKGLYRADASGHRVTRVAVPHRAAEVAVSALFVEGRTLWVGGPTGVATLALQPSVRPVASDAAITRRLTDPRVRVFERGAGNDFWIGTENGLNRYDLRSGAVERSRPAPADPRGLGGTFVASLLLDRGKRLWVGTDGGGISVL
ncbi:MAG: hypothetical protein IAI49_16185, partial [Candidatus Eremiobacteraeota bacterium]|nr:hypothetical protein [Candidatus Eremiobacteraeota bacterium]